MEGQSRPDRPRRRLPLLALEKALAGNAAGVVRLIGTAAGIAGIVTTLLNFAFINALFHATLSIDPNPVDRTKSATEDGNETTVSASFETKPAFASDFLNCLRLMAAFYPGVGYTFPNIVAQQSFRSISPSWPGLTVSETLQLLRCPCGASGASGGN